MFFSRQTLTAFHFIGVVLNDKNQIHILLIVQLVSFSNSVQVVYKLLNVILTFFFLGSYNQF